ncbi:hypothetical protein J22TS1_09130 [Siminovitchia terrae]|nr:hypothetical protein J22TS1_09130 [Siminovitchia terrae]
MFVKDKDDMAKEVRKTEKSDGELYSNEKEEWEIQFAWDRHATFLKAQSRAMSEFRSLVKQFLEMANEDDERRLNLELMQVRIDKTKAEIENISGDNKNSGADDWVTALKEVAEKRKVKRNKQ